MPGVRNIHKHLREAVSNTKNILDGFLYCIDRDCKTYIIWIEYRRNIDTNNLSRGGNERAAGIAGVDSRIGLYDAGEFLNLSTAVRRLYFTVEPWNDANRNWIVVFSERVSDRYNGLS